MGPLAGLRVIDLSPNRFGAFVDFSRSATPALPGALAGQQTDAILAELSKTDAEVAELRQRKIVG